MNDSVEETQGRGGDDLEGPKEGVMNEVSLGTESQTTRLGFGSDWYSRSRPDPDRTPGTYGPGACEDHVSVTNHFQTSPPCPVFYLLRLGIRTTDCPRGPSLNREGVSEV